MSGSGVCDKFFFFSLLFLLGCVLGYRYSIGIGPLKGFTSEDGIGQCRWVEFAVMRRVEASLVGARGGLRLVLAMFFISNYLARVHGSGGLGVQE